MESITRVKRADSLVAFAEFCLVRLELGNAKSKPSRKFGAQVWSITPYMNTAHTVFLGISLISSIVAKVTRRSGASCESTV